MAISQAQAARNKVAAAVWSHQPPEVVALYRAELAYAKAQQAITSWTGLPLIQRARIAAQLLAGNDDDARAA